MARNKNRVSNYSQILDVAAAIFDVKGYHEASMQDIADAAGLTKGGLYHHLASKEETLFAINERYLVNGLKETQHIVFDESKTILERLRRFVIATAAQHDVYNPDLRLSLRELERVGPAYRGRLLELRDEYQAVVQKLLAAGVDAGVLRNDDPALMVKFVFGSINWMCMWYRKGQHYSGREIGEQFADWIIDALRRHDS